MKMRWLTALFVLGLMAPLAAHAQGARATAPGGPQPAIEITTTVHDFGDIYKQDKYVHAFVVHNRGKADLVIEEVKPG
jgi:hypothetical protein